MDEVKEKDASYKKVYSSNNTQFNYRQNKKLLRKLFDDTKSENLKDTYSLENVREGVEGTVNFGDATGGFAYNQFDSGFADTQAATLKDLITIYRQLSHDPFIELAIDNIVTEAVVYDDFKKTISLEMDNIEVASFKSKRIKQYFNDKTDDLKSLIVEEFNNILKFISFSKLGGEYFRQWYIDGRLYAQMIIDPNKPERGVVGLTILDPVKIKKKLDESSGEIYYEYGDTIIHEDYIIFVPSGNFDLNNKIYTSYLHKIVKTNNQLSLLIDSLVVYRITRSPERRVFYVGTGALPTKKAEAFLQHLMQKYRTKMAYDMSTGQLIQKKAIMSMAEDFWFARTGNDKNTEVETLAGGMQLSDIPDINLLKGQLLNNLHVPKSRLVGDESPEYHASESITKEEVAFYDFICGLRNKFGYLLTELLLRHLVLKKIITEADIKYLEENIRYIWNSKNLYSEKKENEIINSRFTLLQQLAESIGDWVSRKWVYKQVLRMSDEEILKMREEIEEEKESGGMTESANTDEYSTGNEYDMGDDLNSMTSEEGSALTDFTDVTEEPTTEDTLETPPEEPVAEEPISDTSMTDILNGQF